MEYVSDKIGEEYKEWKNEDVVFLSAPTGSGKTHFIIHTLLPYVAQTNGYIAYFVNRKALKKQIKKDITEYKRRKGMIDSYKTNCIRVMLYQEIENNTEMELICSIHPNIQKIYMVYDECHYFYHDSTFNTKTEISYLVLRNRAMEFANICQTVEIFISATIRGIKEHIINGSEVPILDQLGYAGHSMSPLQKKFFFPKAAENFKEYTINPDYSYIDLQILESEDSIPDLVCKAQGKWLIFVDSIVYGIELANSLKGSLPEKRTIFLDAGCSDRENARQDMQEIIDSNSSKADILIATSVIYNGISIKDRELRNVIILADNEESFIQMLGRKRRDKEKVNLYVCKKSAVHFTGRLADVDKVLSFSEKYRHFDFGIPCFYFYKNGMASVPNYIIPIYIKDFNSINISALSNYQSQLLEDILTEPNAIDYAKSLFYQYNGLFALNSFSVGRWNQLYRFYTEIIDSFDTKGENAFVYTIGGWLGKTEDEIKDIIKESEKGESEIHREKISKRITEICGNKLSEDDNIRLKIELKEDLLYFLQRTHPEDDDKMVNMVRRTINNIKKPDRPFTEKGFGIMMEKADLPFFVETAGMYKRNEEKFYIIKKAESN